MPLAKLIYDYLTPHKRESVKSTSKDFCNRYFIWRYEQFSEKSASSFIVIPPNFICTGSIRFVNFRLYIFPVLYNFLNWCHINQSNFIVIISLMQWLGWLIYKVLPHKSNVGLWFWKPLMRRSNLHVGWTVLDYPVMTVQVRTRTTNSLCTVNLFASHKFIKFRW